MNWSLLMRRDADCTVVNAVSVGMCLCVRACVLAVGNVCSQVIRCEIR